MQLTDLEYKDLISKLDLIQKRLPNGELAAIRDSIKSLKEDQENIKNDLKDIKFRLLDPEKGIVVRTNQNKQFIENIDKEIEFIKEKPCSVNGNRIEKLEIWKRGIDKFFWIIISLTTSSLFIALFQLIINKK